MTPDDIITKILSAGALITGIAALYGVIVSKRAGIRGDEREARAEEATQRRDTIADRDGLIETLQEEVRSLRQRMDDFEEQLAIEKEYSRMLLDWGYRGGPPPPPARPVRVPTPRG